MTEMVFFLIVGLGDLFRDMLVVPWFEAYSKLIELWLKSAATLRFPDFNMFKIGKIFTKLTNRCADINKELTRSYQ